MKIGIDGTTFNIASKTGIAYYTENLILALAAHAKDSEVFVCVSGSKPLNTALEASNITIKRTAWLSPRVLQGLRRSLLAPPIDGLTGTKADVFLFPNFVSWPLLYCHKSVVIVYDLSFLEVPEYVSPKNRQYLQRFVPRSIAKASHVITISNHTKQQIIKNYGVPENKISVVEPAIDHTRYQPTDKQAINEVKNKLGISKKYILYVGTLEPRKNITGIIDAYKALPDVVKAEYQLVLAGGSGWLDEDINQALESLPTDQLIKPGYVDELDKPALYSGASLFVYPSHYEGWGMQILEAMACGVPVITANNTSLPEAGSVAVKYLTSSSSDELTKAIESVLTSPKLQKKMRQAGLDQAAKFSWDKSSKKTLDVLNQVTQE